MVQPTPYRNINIETYLFENNLNRKLTKQLLKFHIPRSKKKYIFKSSLKNENVNTKESGIFDINLFVNTVADRMMSIGDHFGYGINFDYSFNNSEFSELNREYFENIITFHDKLSFYEKLRNNREKKKNLCFNFNNSDLSLNLLNRENFDNSGISLLNLTSSDDNLNSINLYSFHNLLSGLEVNESILICLNEWVINNSNIGLILIENFLNRSLQVNPLSNGFSINLNNFTDIMNTNTLSSIFIDRLISSILELNRFGYIRNFLFSNFNTNETSRIIFDYNIDNYLRDYITYSSINDSINDNSDLNLNINSLTTSNNNYLYNNLNYMRNTQIRSYLEKEAAYSQENLSIERSSYNTQKLLNSTLNINNNLNMLICDPNSSKNNYSIYNSSGSLYNFILSSFNNKKNDKKNLSGKDLSKSSKVNQFSFSKNTPDVSNFSLDNFNISGVKKNDDDEDKGGGAGMFSGGSSSKVNLMLTRDHNYHSDCIFQKKINHDSFSNFFFKTFLEQLVSINNFLFFLNKKLFILVSYNFLFSHLLNFINFMDYTNYNGSNDIEKKLFKSTNVYKNISII